MGIESLEKLEEKVKKAIARIESLIDDNGRLEGKITELAEHNERLKEENTVLKSRIDELEKQSQTLSEKVKDKVESLLARIDRYEQGS